jgi:hypothetical protein
MLSCLGRIAGIVAPFAGSYIHKFAASLGLTCGASGEQYIASNSSGILWLGAGGIWLSAFVMIFLPVEMRNRQMF